MIRLPELVAREVYAVLVAPSPWMQLWERDPRVVEHRQILERWEDDGGALCRR